MVSPGVHFNIMSGVVNDRRVKNIVGPNASANSKEMIHLPGAESVSTYCYIHHYTNLAADGFLTVLVEKSCILNHCGGPVGLV